MIRHQRICNIPAQFRIVAGHFDIYDMRGIRIVHRDELAQLLVVQIQIQIVDDPVQYRAALDDIRIVIGQRC